MSPENHTEIIKNMFAAFGRGDLPSVFACMHPDVVWDSRYAEGVPLHGAWRGPDAIGEMFGRLFAAATIEAFVPEEFVAQGDKVVVLGHERVRVNASGRTYENRWVHVYALRDGKVAAVTTYNDSAAVRDAFVG